MRALAAAWPCLRTLDLCCGLAAGTSGSPRSRRCGGCGCRRTTGTSGATSRRCCCTRRSCPRASPASRRAMCGWPRRGPTRRGSAGAPLRLQLERRRRPAPAAPPPAARLSAYGAASSASGSGSGSASSGTPGHCGSGTCGLGVDCACVHSRDGDADDATASSGSSATTPTSCLPRPSPSSPAHAGSSPRRRRRRARGGAAAAERRRVRLASAWTLSTPRLRRRARRRVGAPHGDDDALSPLPGARPAGRVGGASTLHHCQITARDLEAITTSPAARRLRALRLVVLDNGAAKVGSGLTKLTRLTAALESLQVRNWGGGLCECGGLGWGRGWAGCPGAGLVIRDSLLLVPCD